MKISPIAICHSCEFGNRSRLCNGPCPCQADPLKRDILVMITLATELLPPPCPIRNVSDRTIPPAPPAGGLPPALPREQWPWYIRLLAEQATPADRGVGDVVERELGETGDRFKAAMAAAGIPCGCEDRKAWLNARFPLNAQ